MPTNANNSDLPDRQTPRMQNYDYSDPGHYCVTICLKGKRKMLGKIVNGNMYPNAIGEAIQRVWETLPKRFSHVELDEFIVMPNHIHCIVALTHPLQLTESPAFAHVPQRFQEHMQIQQAKKKYPPLGEVIRTLKAASTYTIRRMGVPAFAWQSRYHEFVIRTDDELARARHYIVMNPSRWAKDPFNNGPDD